MFKKNSSQNFYSDLLKRGLIILSVALIGLYSYTLFHSLAEIIVITIGYGVYMVTWSLRRRIANKYFVFLGIAFFFIATFDLLHAFTFQKTGTLLGYNFIDLSEQFWLAARYLQALSFLVACFFIGKIIKALRIFYFYFLIFILILVGILWLPFLVSDQLINIWQSTFTVLSGIIIILLQIVAIIMLNKKAEHFNKRIFRLLVWVLVFNSIAELFLIFYNGTYNHTSVLANLFRIVSFNLIYIVFIEIVLNKPFAVLFKEIKDSEMNFRRSEQKFHAIFNNTTVGIMISDLNGYIIESNQHFLDISGYEQKNLAALSLFEPNILASNLGKIDALKELRSGYLDKYIFENKYRKKDGTILWGDTSVSLLKDIDNKAQYILWIIRDITESKDVEQAKTEFVSLISHQLRTHLTSISLGSELLLRNSTEPADNKQIRYLREIHESTKRMSEIIKNLLNVSRVELGTFNIKSEAVNLKKSIKQIINDLSRQLKVKSLHLYYDRSNLPLISFDAQILRIILENLLANAIAYTPVNGSINIKTQVRGNSILLMISDTGCGISEEDKDKIFSKLFRASNARTISPTGNGLGLYIVKALAEQAGAEISFESRLGEGTTFYLSLPLLKKQFPDKQGELWIETKNAPSSEA